MPLPSGSGTLTGDLDKSAETISVVDRDVGKHLAIDFDSGVAQAVDQLRVAHALEPCGSVDAGDPETAEIALAHAAVTVDLRP